MSGSVIKRSDNPCKDCTERSAECHSTCKDYISWRKKRDEDIAEVKKRKEINNINRTYLRELNEKIRRAHR